MAGLMKANFHTVSLKSFEDDDSPSEGFFCEKTINKDFTETNMVSKSYITGQSELKSFFNSGKIAKTVNQNGQVINTTSFDYDSAGSLLSIVVTTIGEGDSLGFSEKRIYSYDEKGRPEKMTRSKNGKQVSIITFVVNEEGNVIEEHSNNPAADKKYYYYYNDKSQLTDIVHYNAIAKKLLPDYMFLYNLDGEVAQMISVDETGRNYYIWKYAYNSYHLPEIQKCYSKEKRLLGTIQYEYR